MNFLVELLFKKHYISKKNFAKWPKSDYYVYGPELAAAVRRFQKDAGITQTGYVDNQTSSELKTWDENKTTIEVGLRELTIGDSGTDVSQLVELLSIAGYQPNPEKSQTKSGVVVFNEEVETAIKIFQAYNGLTVTGKADTPTINKLKNRK